MSKILLAVSDRWVPDARVDSIADFALRLSRGILAVHVAYGTEGNAADVSPGERILDQVAKQLRVRSGVMQAGAAGGGAGAGGGGTGVGLASGVGAGGVKVETLFLFSDDVGAAILKTAEEHKATAIVLGLSSKGMLTRLIEGNVAQEIIRGARVPVILLPPDWMGTI